MITGSVPLITNDHGVGSTDHVITGTDPMITRHSPSKLGSALALLRVAVLQFQNR